MQHDDSGDGQSSRLVSFHESKPVANSPLFDVASRLYIERTRRRNFFDQNLLQEPVWDMLLSLYVALGRGETLSVAGVVMASGVPVTTGLRWLAVMEERSMIAKRRHPSEGLSPTVELTSSARATMDRYLQRILLERQDTRSSSGLRAR